MILITGAAGFIGFHLCSVLCKRGKNIIGIDNFSGNPAFSTIRTSILKELYDFEVLNIDFTNQDKIQKLFEEYPNIETIIHLGARAGVRYSIINPYDYIDNNVTGFMVILEKSKKLKNLKHIIYASTSSVYGTNQTMPFTEDQKIANPVSYYAATKIANEVMASAHCELYKVPITGVRFFTVYGPLGRIDMAYHKFIQAINLDKPFEVYNHGNMKRDFTYVTDIVSGIIGATEYSPSGHEIFNLGYGASRKVGDMITLIERHLEKKGRYTYLPMQQGDMKETFANIDKAKKALNYDPKISLEQGINLLIQGMQKYENLNVYAKS